MPEELGFLKYLKQAKVGGGGRCCCSPAECLHAVALACDHRSCSSCVNFSSSNPIKCQPEQQ